MSLEKEGAKGAGSASEKARADAAGSLEGGSVVVALPDLARVRVVGADRVDFLHGQLANDVRGLPVGGAVASLLLNVRGHALAEVQVCRRPEDLLLLIPDGRAPLVLESLRRHIVFDQVELIDESASWSAFTLQGQRAAAAARAALAVEPPSAGAFVELAGWGSLLCYPSRRSGPSGFDLLVLRDRAAELQAALHGAGAVPAEPADLASSRVRSLVPSAATEAGEGVLPQEAGLVGLVSFRKGCYLGQEIMARIEARGAVRRSLARLRLWGRPDAGEREVTWDGRNVGRLGTVAVDGDGRILALAVLRNDLPADAELLAGGVPARLQAEAG